MLPDELPDDANPIAKDFFDYYKGRAFHPCSINSITSWDAVSPWGYYNFPLQQHIDQIKAPKLSITGEKAHSRPMAEATYEKLTGSKKLIIVPGATHCDLYDRMDKIPFDNLTSFCKENLQ